MINNKINVLFLIIFLFFLGVDAGCSGSCMLDKQVALNPSPQEVFFPSYVVLLAKLIILESSSLCEILSPSGGGNHYIYFLTSYQVSEMQNAQMSLGKNRISLNSNPYILWLKGKGTCYTIAFIQNTRREQIHAGRKQIRMSESEEVKPA